VDSLVMDSVHLLVVVDLLLTMNLKFKENLLLVVVLAHVVKAVADFLLVVAMTKTMDMHLNNVVVTLLVVALVEMMVFNLKDAVDSNLVVALVKAMVFNLKDVVVSLLVVALVETMDPQIKAVVDSNLVVVKQEKVFNLKDAVDFLLVVDSPIVMVFNLKDEVAFPLVADLVQTMATVKLKVAVAFRLVVADRFQQNLKAVEDLAMVVEVSMAINMIKVIMESVVVEEALAQLLVFQIIQPMTLHTWVEIAVVFLTEEEIISLTLANKKKKLHNLHNLSFTNVGLSRKQPLLYNI